MAFAKAYSILAHSSTSTGELARIPPSRDWGETLWVQVIDSDLVHRLHKIVHDVPLEDRMVSYYLHSFVLQLHFIVSSS